MIHLSDVNIWVTNGAALLDRHYPGWENQIKTNDLNLKGSESCVLGQLYGSYYDGVAELCLGGDVHEYGFSFSNIKLIEPPVETSDRAAGLHIVSTFFKTVDTQNDALILCWKEEIRKRLGKSSPVRVRV